VAAYSSFVKAIPNSYHEPAEYLVPGRPKKRPSTAWRHSELQRMKTKMMVEGNRFYKPKTVVGHPHANTLLGLDRQMLLQYELCQSPRKQRHSHQA